MQIFVGKIECLRKICHGRDLLYRWQTYYRWLDTLAIPAFPALFKGFVRFVYSRKEFTVLLIKCPSLSGYGYLFLFLKRAKYYLQNRRILILHFISKWSMRKKILARSLVKESYSDKDSEKNLLVFGIHRVPVTI